MYNEAQSYNNSYRESYNTSVITDPTFRGGKYPQAYKYDGLSHAEATYLKIRLTQKSNAQSKAIL